MNASCIPLYYVGNLDSVLFRQRLAVLQQLVGHPEYKIICTKRATCAESIHLLFSYSYLLFLAFATTKSIKIVFHGAYNPILWLMLLRRNVHAVSILQGSELTIDFVGLRRPIIKLFLAKSKAVLCRSEEQKKLVTKIVRAEKNNLEKVKWGLDKELFKLPLVKRTGPLRLISPRATQPEYNIDIIFRAVEQLKARGIDIHFTYVRFNATIEIDVEPVADEIVESPDQATLWKKLMQADVCISVPDYDGLSNTVIEGLALGCLPIFNIMPQYNFLLSDRNLGVGVTFRGSSESRVQRLVEGILLCRSNIDNLRAGAEFRRNFSEMHFKEPASIDFLKEILAP